MDRRSTIKSLLTLEDTSIDVVHMLIQHAKKLKSQPNCNNFSSNEHKAVGLLFEKQSTRTRCAFEVALAEIGAKSIFLSKQDLQLGEKETIEDTARVFGRMFSAIVFRGYSHKTLEILHQESNIPVINALTDQSHPTQALADAMTLDQHFGTLKNLRIAYVGDARNNVACSLIMVCAMLGVSINIAAPQSLMPSTPFLQRASSYASKTNATITCFTNAKKAVTGVQAVYTDVWTSMGEEHKKSEKQRLLQTYQVNQELMRYTDYAVFLHCLPANRGAEVTSEIIDSTDSLVWEQAENKKHTAKAVLLACLNWEKEVL